MDMAGRGADHGVEILLPETLPPVAVGLGVREAHGSGREMVGVHIAEGRDVLAADAFEIGGTAPADADDGMLSLLLGERVPAMMPLGRIKSPALASDDCLRKERRSSGDV
jgi:hypothetical protein